jgi:type IX secretion system PorP/SprF family membrane protein
VATGYVNRQKMHIYLMGGKTFTLNEEFSLKTGSMLRWVQSAPVSFEIAGLFGFKEKFYAGGMFRFGSSYGFLAQFKPTFQLTIGYSYDLTITELSTFHGGTHEIMLSYDFNVFE